MSEISLRILQPEILSRGVILFYNDINVYFLLGQMLKSRIFLYLHEDLASYHLHFLLEMTIDSSGGNRITISRKEHINRKVLLILYFI